MIQLPRRVTISVEKFRADRDWKWTVFTLCYYLPLLFCFVFEHIMCLRNKAEKNVIDCIQIFPIFNSVLNVIFSGLEHIYLHNILLST